MSKVCVEFTPEEIEHIAEFLFGELCVNLYGPNEIEQDLSEWSRFVAKYKKQRSEHDEDMRCRLDLDAKLLTRLAQFLPKHEVANA